MILAILAVGCGKHAASEPPVATAALGADDKIALHVTGAPGTWIEARIPGNERLELGDETRELPESGVRDYSVAYDWKETSSLEVEICDGRANLCGPKQTLKRARALVADRDGHAFSCRAASCRVELAEIASPEGSAQPGIAVDGDQGTVIEAQGHREMIGENHSTRLAIAPPELGTLTMDQITKGMEIEVAFTLTLPDGTKLPGKGTEQVQLVNQLWRRLDTVDTGPVLFAGEIAAPSRDRVLFLWNSGMTFVGTPTRPQDIDLIAKRTFVERRQSCGMYENTATGERERVGLSMRDVTLTVYERRSARKRGSRTWIAPTPPCGKVRSENSSSVAAETTGDAAWLKAFVKT